MKRVIEIIKEKKWIHYLIIIAIGLLVSIPLFYMQVRMGHDGFLHLIRLIGLDNSIKESQFPFLVAPYLCRNFGYSMTSLYPPIVAYIPYILGLITNTFYIGLKLFAALTIIFSGIFMYNFIYEVTKNNAISFLAAVIYIVFPYHFELIYTRFAIGEFTAMVFLPIVFQGLYNLINGDGKRHYYIAIGAIGLLLSHTITTIYAALFCMIYVLVHIKTVLKKDIIIKCVINIVFILLITALFTIPMIEFKTQADYSIFETSVMKTSGEYTQKNTIEFWQFLKDKGEEGGVSFVVGVPTLIMLCITILAWQDIDEKYKKFYVIYLCFGILSIIMCTNLFPWKYVPQIFNNIQYPWRMVGWFMFFLTPVFAMNVYHTLKCVKKEKVQVIIYIFIVLILGVFTIQKLSNYKWEDQDVDKKYENDLRANSIISHFAVNRDYLPYNSLKKQFTYLQDREDRVYVLSGNAIIENENKKALDLSFKIKSAEKNTILELPYFFYPGYSVCLEYDNNTVELNTSESDNGFVQVIVPENIENGTIKFTYTGTTLEKVSYVISAVSLIGFIIYIVYFKKKVREGKCDEKK